MPTFALSTNVHLTRNDLRRLNLIIMINAGGVQIHPVDVSRMWNITPGAWAGAKIAQYIDI